MEHQAEHQTYPGEEIVVLTHSAPTADQLMFMKSGWYVYCLHLLHAPESVGDMSKLAEVKSEFYRKVEEVSRPKLPSFIEPNGLDKELLASTTTAVSHRAFDNLACGFTVSSHLWWTAAYQKFLHQGAVHAIDFHNLMSHTVIVIVEPTISEELLGHFLTNRGPNQAHQVEPSAMDSERESELVRRAVAVMRDVNMCDVFVRSNDDEALVYDVDVNPDVQYAASATAEDREHGAGKIKKMTLPLGVIGCVSLDAIFDTLVSSVKKNAVKGLQVMSVAYRPTAVMLRLIDVVEFLYNAIGQEGSENAYRSKKGLQVPLPDDLRDAVKEHSAEMQGLLADSLRARIRHVFWPGGEKIRTLDDLKHFSAFGASEASGEALADELALLQLYTNAGRPTKLVEEVSTSEVPMTPPAEAKETAAALETEEAAGKAEPETTEEEAEE
ncbi:MAG: hypothetical protein MHM6MM_006671 [Cercozoa sp. M6MM]